jgi:hypothetical protein
MSALGHKRTFAVQNGMSALPPKADMCSATRDVRFVPIATSPHLLDPPVLNERGGLNKLLSLRTIIALHASPQLLTAAAR